MWKSSDRPKQQQLLPSQRGGLFCCSLLLIPSTPYSLIPLLPYSLLPYPGITLSTLQDHKLGSCGKPMKCCEVIIHEPDVTELNRQLPVYKRILRVKTRDTEFPKTTSLKIKRVYKD